MPTASASGGSPSEATRPPIGTFAWRMPRASPRSENGNQCITARPLAAFTLAPKAPAVASRMTNTP